MLSSIKEKSKGPVTYIIVGLISLTFVITAMYGIDFSGSSKAVAVVNGDEVSRKDFLSEFESKKRRLQQDLAEKYTPEFDRVLKDSTLESMINRHLLDQLANNLSYATTLTELQTVIQSNSAFHVDGKFSMDRYKQLLRMNGYSDTQYESIKLAELTQGQIKNNLFNSAFVVPSTLKNLKVLNDQQRDFSYIKLSSENYKGKVEVDPKSIQSYYNDQVNSFFEPRKVKVDFIELSLSQIAKDIQANDDELFNFYEEEKERFTTEEERRAQHILIESEAQAKKLSIQLKEGEDFTKLASKYSLDSGSKDNGGDLGFFTRGVMVPEFEEEVFDMKEGEISKPVKSEFGYHVIKLNNIQVGTVKPFDSVKDELTKLYKQTKAQNLLYDLTDQLTNLAYEASLEEVSDQMGLGLRTTEFFEKNTIKHSPKFAAAAYSDIVFNKGENSELIEISKDKFVVLRVKDKLAQRQKSFDEVKGEINTHLTTLLAKTFVDNLAKKISGALSDGDLESAQALMDKNQLKWENTGWIGRDSDKASASIVNKVFALPKPNGGVTYSAQSLNKRQAVILKLSAVKTSSEAPNGMLVNTLLSFESDEMFKGILTTLRKNADIQIFTERL